MKTNRRGATSGWIVLIVILGLLVALVGWKMITDQHASAGDAATTTMPD